MDVQKTRSDKINFSEKQIAEIEEMASKLLPIKAICFYFGISADTFGRRFDENEDIRNAVGKGRARGLAELSSIAHKKALGGDSGMLKYLLGKYDDHFRVKDHREPHTNGKKSD